MSEPVPDDLKTILGPNEQLQLYIKQKIYHPKINIDSVVITNERLILRHPHALGLKKDYTDYNYQDISNVVLDKGMLRSTVRCTLRFGGEPLELSSLPNADAEKAYGLLRENLVRYQSPFTAASAGVPPYRQPAAPAALGTAYCKQCGSPLNPGQKFCGSCGAPV
ncbi:MAG TPA: PH domain-containing protein [Nitrososphaerales archaeon]|nr:PH domain-containing protein [Nitrososphaerales archaeon]